MEQKVINKVLVVGAGVMGHSISQVFAGAGFAVGLVDVDQKVLDRAMDLIESELNTMAAFGKISKNKVSSILTRITPSTNLAGMARDADFIIEAVSEVPKVKKKVFSQLEASCPAEAIIASNTSGLDIFSIADAKRPERFVITHFFSPAHIIPLVEVVPGPKTSQEVISFTTDLLKESGKSPIEMNEFIPSFIVNRIQNAIGSVVMEMLDNGWASPEDIDLAVKYSLGIRLPILGVVQTADFTGLDLVSQIFKSIGKRSPFFDEKVRQGHFGVKTSKGIYDYRGRSESEILKKRDGLFLKMIDFLKEIDAFEPV
jgi:3-hydroxybutyryl-CoA dehydrogenase